MKAEVLQEMNKQSLLLHTENESSFVEEHQKNGKEYSSVYFLELSFVLN